jgi:hypothetical protein
MENAKSNFLLEIQHQMKETRGAGTLQLRDFGYVMAIAFAIVGILPFITRGASYRLWTLPLTSAFLLFAVFLPKGLTPLYRAWMLFGGVLGYVNSRLILGIVFFALFAPIGIVLRLMGKDLLGLKIEKGWKTYRQFPVKEEKTQSLKRQF